MGTRKSQISLRQAAKFAGRSYGRSGRKQHVLVITETFLRPEWSFKGFWRSGTGTGSDVFDICSDSKQSRHSFLVTEHLSRGGRLYPQNGPCFSCIYFIEIALPKNLTIWPLLIVCVMDEYFCLAVFKDIQWYYIWMHVSTYSAAKVQLISLI